VGLASSSSSWTSFSSSWARAWGDHELIDLRIGRQAAAARIWHLHTLVATSVVGDRGERPSHTTISSPAAFASLR
jgi:hypothetical protein